ncbi:rRNA maturation RNase YbeY [Mesoplasma syrphidae]|uniref:Endoribonuclease YbeY n=1 Tax=Mesoplasma syrphidae TaxID=225999 RepID=A0A2K9C2B3_9MOLU|nr:rRNA maturation RNase YbeY [Mesoplasma syrphidae]AUF83619.1 rRNA maturation RNase YbeY [Mesoplasma syrphidae]
MIEINFINETSSDMKKWEKFAKNIFTNAHKVLNLKEKIELSVTFVNSQRAQEINQQYRGKNYIADVTSFPVELSSQEVIALGVREVGDIFLCLEEAQRKTIKYDHTIEQEMGFLFAHGFLHLLGYDHETSLEDETRMFKLQDDILLESQINYEIKFVDEDYIGE